MNLEAKKWIVAILSVFFLASLLVVAWVEGGRTRVVDAPDSIITKENEDCITCHAVKTTGIVGQWHQSVHAKQGIGCLECHRANEGEPDAHVHEGELIATIVSPKDCSKCHEREYKEFTASHHAAAGKILGSLDNVLAEVVEGHVVFDENGEKIKASPAAVSGCLQCHGSEIKVLEDGKLDAATWPNTGMGRLNPDGSNGSCSACHQRHDFSMAQARQPENCGRCHLGPDHPQLEVYNESKHGIAFAANRMRFTPMMDEKDWRPGVDYEQGPTCSSCHMGATKTLPATHDVGDRISWTLRPAISEKIDAAALKKGLTDVKTWETRRADMKNVCLSCHGPEWVENWYLQYDGLVNLYNDKFARPATELFKMARSGGLFTNEVNFDDRIEFTYFLLWHHEGRRARHGAAMMGPDYTQWHGMFEVAERFYHEFIPELREVIEHGKETSPATDETPSDATAEETGDEKGEGKAAVAEKVEKRLEEILESDMHRWVLGKMSDGERKARKRAADEFKKRYAQ
jgi:hypothetical protein